MLLNNLSIVLSQYALFLYFFVPIWLYLVLRSDLRRPFVVSISFTVTLFGYATLYFLCRLATEQHFVIKSLMFLTPLVIAAAALFRSKWKVDFRPFGNFFVFQNPKAVVCYLGIMILYALVLSPYLLRNGLDTNGNLQLYDLFATEGMWHANIIAGVRENIIPTTLHFVSTDVFNYHFFPDLFIEMFSSLTNSDNYIVSFTHFFVPVMLLALSVNIYALTLSLWNRSSIALLAVFISLFCYDLSAITLWLRGLIKDHSLLFGSIIPTNLSAWTPIITQFQIFHNPSYLFSSVLFFGLIVLTDSYSKNKSKWMFLLSCIGWAFLLKAKITTYLIGISALFCYGVLKLWFHKDPGYLKVTAGAFILSIPFLMTAVGQPKNSAEFSKWYFPANFALRAHHITEETRLEINEYGFPSKAADQAKFAVSFIIFYAGLLNVRLIGLFRKFNLKKLTELIGNPSLHTMLFLSVAAGMFAFIFICNSLSKYDSMWFYLVILFLLNIYTAERIVTLFSRRSAAALLWKIGAVFLLFSTSASFIIPCIYQEPENQVKLTVSKAEMEALKAIRTHSGRGRVLTGYFHLNETEADERNQLAGALSGKKIVSEGVDYIFEYRTKDPGYLARLKNVRSDIRSFYQTEDVNRAKNILQQYQVSYILLKNGDTLKFKHEGILQKIFSEAGVNVYFVTINDQG